MRQTRLVKGFFRYTIAALAALLFASIAAFGQSDTGSLSGTVRDQNGAVVPGAAVTAKNQSTGDERATTSNTDGMFSIPALRAAAYTVTATTTGLDATVKDVAVNVGRETSLNIGMKLGDVTASVNVVATDEATVTTGSASMGANVNPREVEGLPINGRQLSQLYLQAPGAMNSGSAPMATFVSQAAQRNRTSSAMTASKERRSSIPIPGI